MEFASGEAENVSPGRYHSGSVAPHHCTAEQFAACRSSAGNGVPGVQENRHDQVSQRLGHSRAVGLAPCGAFLSRVRGPRTIREQGTSSFRSGLFLLEPSRRSIPLWEGTDLILRHVVESAEGVILVDAWGGGRRAITKITIGEPEKKEIL
jgi:hypothetical protein